MASNITIANLIKKDNSEFLPADLTLAQSLCSNSTVQFVQSNCCLEFSLPTDMCVKNGMIKVITKAFPGTPLYWTSDTKAN